MSETNNHQDAAESQVRGAVVPAAKAGEHSGQARRPSDERDDLVHDDDDSMDDELENEPEDCREL
jgi:hypothetical protein